MRGPSRIRALELPRYLRQQSRFVGILKQVCIQHPVYCELPPAILLAGAVLRYPLWRRRTHEIARTGAAFPWLSRISHYISIRIMARTFLGPG
jgi:hypothetical protein